MYLLSKYYVTNQQSQPVSYCCHMQSRKIPSMNVQLYVTMVRRSTVVLCVDMNIPVLVYDVQISSYLRVWDAAYTVNTFNIRELCFLFVEGISPTYFMQKVRRRLLQKYIGYRLR